MKITNEGSRGGHRVSDGGALEPWETPQISELDVNQTAMQPGVGLDGSFFPDCTHS